MEKLKGNYKEVEMNLRELAIKLLEEHNLPKLVKLEDCIGKTIKEICRQDNDHAILFTDGTVQLFSCFDATEWNETGISNKWRDYLLVLHQSEDEELRKAAASAWEVLKQAEETEQTRKRQESRYTLYLELKKEFEGQ